MNKTPDATPQEAGEQWATRTIHLAWGGAILAVLAGACTAVVISEALLWRWVGAGGAWGGALFFACLLFAIGAWVVLARYAFGKGSVSPRCKKRPPKWALTLMRLARSVGAGVALARCVLGKRLLALCCKKLPPT